MFLGMCMSGFCLEPFVGRLLGERKREYDAYQEMRYGRVARLRSKHAIIMFFLPAILLSFALLDTYFVFSKNQIMVFDWFLGLREERYLYTDVERVLAAPASIAPNGNTRNEWCFVIYFHNGKRWNCKSDPSNLDEEGRKRLAEFVSQKSKVSIEEVPVLQRKDQ